MSAFIVPMSSLPTISGVSQARAGEAAQAAQKNSVPFSDFLQGAVQDLSGAAATSQQAIQDLALGGTDDLHTGSIAALKSAAAVNYTSSLVSAALRAYNELMRMQL